MRELRSRPSRRLLRRLLRVRLFQLRRRLLRREAAVEGLPFRGHLFQQLWGREARAVFRFKPAAQLDEFFRSHEVNIAQRTPGERRKAEAEDRADVGLARIGDDVILYGPRGL